MKRKTRQKAPSLEALWDSVPQSREALGSALPMDLPEAARGYLRHAIAPGTPLASAVRLRMHGEIRLKRWFPFEAEQVLRWDRGMIWRATVRLHGVPVRGSDSLIDGAGSMQWRLLGLIPILRASGDDITRSALGRVAAESVWLPSVLCSDTVFWTTPGPALLRAILPVQGHSVTLEFRVDDAGGLSTVRLQRWGNPLGAPFHLAVFGAAVEEEQTFAGYTIPTRLRVGWHFKDGVFANKGEFFRVRIDRATYR